MRGIAGQPRGIARLARTLGLDSNPLCRTLASADPAKANESKLPDIGARWEGAGSSARTDEVLAGATTRALVALALLAALRLTVMFLNRQRLAAWETAWSRVGPQWSKGRS
jgi:hypothetical protein